MVVAAIGIVVNGATATLFASGRKGDINIQGAFLHMAGDAAVSAGVVASAGHPGDEFLMEAARLLRTAHKIGHATLQIEVDENNECALAPDDVV